MSRSVRLCLKMKMDASLSNQQMGYPESIHTGKGTIYAVLVNEFLFFFNSSQQKSFKTKISNRQLEILKMIIATYDISRSK